MLNGGLVRKFVGIRTVTQKSFWAPTALQALYWKRVDIVSFNPNGNSARQVTSSLADRGGYSKRKRSDSWPQSSPENSRPPCLWCHRPRPSCPQGAGLAERRHRPPNVQERWHSFALTSAWLWWSSVLTVMRRDRGMRRLNLSCERQRVGESGWPSLSAKTWKTPTGTQGGSGWGLAQEGQGRKPRSRSGRVRLLWCMQVP